MGDCPVRVFELASLGWIKGRYHHVTQIIQTATIVFGLGVQARARALDYVHTLQNMYAEVLHT